MKTIFKVIFCGAAALLAGCGGGGGITISPSSQSLGGVWTGNFTQNGTSDPVQGLIDEAGLGYFLDTSNGVIYRISAGANGSAISGSFRAFAPAGFVFSNNSSFIDGSLSGTAQQRVQLSGSTSSSVGGNSTFLVTYQSASYERSASFATIAGTYIFSTATDTVTITITSSGAVTGSSVAGCVLNGNVVVIDTNYNAYTFVASSACTGLPTQNVTGLASFTPATGSAAASLFLAYDDNATATVTTAIRQ